MSGEKRLPGQMEHAVMLDDAQQVPGEVCEPLVIGGIIRARAVADAGSDGGVRVDLAALPGLRWPLADFRELCRWGNGVAAKHHPARLKPPGNEPACSAPGCAEKGKVGTVGAGGQMTWRCAAHDAEVRRAALLGGAG